MGIMKQRVTAVVLAAAFLIFAGVLGADAQQRRSTFDDWLGFDQTDHSFDQPTRERTFTRDWETQPDRSFCRLSRKRTSRPPKRP